MNKKMASLIMWAGVCLIVLASAGARADVVPFQFGTASNGTAQWTTAQKNTGSYSVDLYTSSSAGSYAGVAFDPIPATIDDITTLTFYYRHVANNGSAGPRLGLNLDDSGTYYLAVSGAAVTSIAAWAKANGVTGSNLVTFDPDPTKVWWYGTWDGSNPATYSQLGGPVSFAALQAALNGDIVMLTVYMGQVDNTNVFRGEAYVDDADVNGLTYYGKIQDAADAVASGSTINVRAGTYSEQVTIQKSLTLTGAGKASTTILAPAADRANSVSVGPIWSIISADYILGAYPPSGTIDVRVEGFTIDANGEDKSSGTAAFIGALFKDVDGATAGLFFCDVKNFGADAENSAIRIYGNSDLTIDDNTAAGYTKDGFGFWGNDDADPNNDPVFVASNNVTTGTASARYGILVAYDATGSLSGNTVKNHSKSSSEYGRGLYIFDTNNVTVNNSNQIENCYRGIELYSSGSCNVSNNTLRDNIERHILLSLSNNNTLSANTINGTVSGSERSAVELTSSASGNTIGGSNPADGNNITMATSGTGLLYAIYVTGNGSASNTVQNNTINGGQRALQQDGGQTPTTTFSDNIVANITSPAFGGACLSGGSAIISGNAFTNSVRPVEFWGAGTVTVSGNTINGSTFAGMNCGSASGAVTVSGNEIYNTPGGQWAIWVQNGCQNVQISGNNIHDTVFGGVSVSGSAIISGNTFTNTIRPIEFWGATNLTISNNTINGANWDAINCGSASGNINVAGNTIYNAGVSGIHARDGADNIVATNNEIYNCNTGILLDTLCTGAQITNNSIHTNATIGLQNNDAGTVNASANWWGINTPAGVAAEVSANVDYTPWLEKGTDTSSDPGFQGDFAALHVDDDSPQTGLVGRVQEGVNLVSGSTVYVAPGTYVEQVTIHESMQLLGAGKASTTLQAPAADRPSSIAAGVVWAPIYADYIVGASAPSGTIGVRVEGFTIDANGEDKSSGTNVFVGVLFKDVDETTAGLYLCDVKNFGAADGNNGVRVYGDSNLTIDNTVVSGYTVDGIGLWGDDDADTADDPVFVVSNSETSGTTEVTRFGIFVGYDATGTVSGNTIKGHNLSTGSFRGHGIYLFDTNNVTINGSNQIDNCYRGIGLHASSGNGVDGNTITNSIERHIMLSGSSSNNTISANTLSGASPGATMDAAIVIGDVCAGNMIGGTSAPEGNSITVPFTGPAPQFPYGIWVQTPAGSNNTVRYNILDGGNRSFQQDGGFAGTTTIADNTIGNAVSPSFAGVYLNGGSAVITGNTMNNAVRPIEFWNPNNVTITGNTLNGSTYDQINCGSFLGTVTINGNKLINTVANRIRNQTLTNIDATGNYWGTISWAGYNAVTGIKDLYSGPVTWEPWSDSTLALTYYKPDTTYADDDNAGNSEEAAGSSGGTYAYNAFEDVQDAVNNVEGSTVNVANGTYTGNVLVNKSLTMIGQSRTGAILQSASGDTVRVTAADVAIETLSINHGAGGTSVNLDTGSTGTVEKCNITGATGGTGIKVSSALYSLGGNDISGTTLGIQVNTTATQGLILGNHLHLLLGDGIDLGGGSTTLCYNTFDNALNGVVQSDGSGNVMHWNNIFKNTVSGVTDSVGNLLNAENNWWGAAGGANSTNADKAFGNVDCDPYLNRPFVSDQDGDGLWNWEEDRNGNGIQDAGETNLNSKDSDGDGWEDGVEVLLLGSDPLNASSPGALTDADGDGVPATVDPDDSKKDTDGDKYTDAYEMTHGYSPTNSGSHPTLGDIDLTPNGVTNLDAVRILNCFVGNILYKNFAFENMDVDRNGSITNLDAVRDINFFVGNIPYMPTN